MVKSKKFRVAVALSGGVDSSVAAALLVKQGFEVAGVHIRLGKFGKSAEESAGKTAKKLGLPLEIINLSEFFKKKVVGYFLSSYTAGLTPNPCVVCNQLVKFGRLLDYVKSQGFDYLATGHYARIKQGRSMAPFSLISARKNMFPPGGGTSAQIRSKGPLRAPDQQDYFRLLTAADKKKDQSYFLYRLNQKQLNQVLFPVGDYIKKKVRQMARKWNLASAERPESQEICFLSGSSCESFLAARIQEKILPGKVIDSTGKIVGVHQGLPLYTIGQRRGFKISNVTFCSKNSKQPKPAYVIDKDVESNILTVGTKRQAERKEFQVKNLSFIGPGKFARQKQLLVKIRSSGGFLKISQLITHNSQLQVLLTKPELGIAPGQSAVFYQEIRNKEFEVLGGGIITS